MLTQPSATAKWYQSWIAYAAFQGFAWRLRRSAHNQTNKTLDPALRAARGFGSGF
jgi:hypothetical protein